MRVSASQVETFQGCRRKWFGASVLKMPVPQSPAQVLGEDIHSSSEIYLNTGVIPVGVELVPQKFGKPPVEKDLGYVRRYTEALVTIMPKPMGPELVVEHELKMRLPQGVDWIGFIDIADSSGETLRIDDIKSSSNLKYAKTEAELVTNIQMVSYGHYSYAELGHKGNTELSHLYVETRLPKTKPPRTLPVRALVTELEIEREWRKILPIVDEMLVVAESESFQGVTPTGVTNGQCYKYGGCPFLSDCGLTTQTRKSKNLFAGLLGAGKKSEDDSVGSFKDSVKKLTKANGRTLPPDAPSRKVEDDEDEAPKAKKMKAKAVEAEEEEVMDDEEEAAPVKKKSGFKAAQAAAAVEDDDAEEDSGVINEYPMAKGNRVAVKSDAAEEEKPKAKRGRPSKAAQKLQAKAREVEAEEAAEEEAGEIPAFTLYIDCSPAKAPGDGELYPTLFEDWFMPIVDTLNIEVRREEKIPDYRLLGFAQEKVAITQALLKELPNVPAVLVMDSRIPGASEAKSVLIPHATQVIRSFR